MSIGGLRAAVVCLGAALALSVAPGTVAADVIFDPADAKDLADTLAEATKAQGVCYGWNVHVDDQYAGVDTGTSVGSNFGPGLDVNDAPGADRCKTTVEFDATITYTSDSSESDDSASYSVNSAPKGPTTDDLNALGIVDENGLVGDNPDIEVNKAVAALPQLASDDGVARPMQATPEPVADAGSSHLTDNPGSDFWRRAGNYLLWGSLLLLAGIVFAIYAIRSSRREQIAQPSSNPPSDPPPDEQR
jgi:opacity protein-like surface antigen